MILPLASTPTPSIGALPTIHCANPACPSAGVGAPRVLLLAWLAPGSIVEVPRCPRCGWRTTVRARADGGYEAEARPR